MVALELAGVEGVEVFDAVAGELGEGGHGFGQRSAFAHDEFVVPDVDGFLLADLIEVLGAKHGGGHRAVVLLVELGFDEGALDAERGGGVEVLLAQALDALVHAAFVGGVFNTEIHA